MSQKRISNSEREVKRKRERAELASKRRVQLEEAKGLLIRRHDEAKAAAMRLDARESLANHLSGFYDEIEKLAKGRSIVEATTLAVNAINDVIKDAKALIAGDVHLDRVKEFVPAGENPPYSDVLLIARAVQQCLGRQESSLRSQVRDAEEETRSISTLVAALELMVEDQDLTPSKEDVEGCTGQKASPGWFVTNPEDGELYFDVSRLDPGAERG